MESNGNKTDKAVGKSQVDLKQNIIIGLLIANLVFSMTFIYNRQNIMDNQLRNVENQVSMLGNQMNRISGDVVYQIQQMEEEAMNLVADFNYDYVGLNGDNQTVKTKFTVDLKERQEGGRVYFVLENEDGKGLSIESGDEDLMSFSASLDLAMDQNYELKIIEESASGSRQMNRENYYLNLRQDFYERRVEETMSGGGSNNKCVYYNKGFMVNDYGIDGFGVAEVRFVMTMGEEVIYEEVVTDQLIDVDALSAKERTMIAAGEMLVEVPTGFGGISEEAVAEVVLESKREESNDIVSSGDIKRFIFQKVMVYDDYPNLHINPDMMYEMDGYLVVTFEDGSSMRVW